MIISIWPGIRLLLQFYYFEAMKKRLLIITILLVSVATAKAQQSLKVATELKEYAISFTNTSVNLTHTDSQPISPSFIPSTTRIIPSIEPAFYALTIFSGLKYRSPIDQFLSIYPFDDRAIQASSFSDLELITRRNYLLQTPASPAQLWMDR